MPTTMGDLPQDLLLVALAVLAWTLVMSVLRVLAGRVSLILARHDLLVESKRRRIAFHAELAALRRSKTAAGDVLIEDEPAYDVIVEDDPPHRAAA